VVAKPSPLRIKSNPVVGPQLSEDIFANLSLPVVLLNDAGEIVDVNPICEELLGRSRERLKGCVLPEVLIQCADLGPRIEKVVNSGEQLLMRGVELMLADGREYIADCWLRPLDTPGYILLELHAEADRQLLTRHARRKQQAESLALLRRTLCHEVRNPLGGMRGAAQLLVSELDKPAQDPELLAYAELIIREVDRLNTLVEQLGQEDLQLASCSVNLAQIIENAWQLLRLEQENPPRVVLDFDPSIPLLDGNADALQQVLLNLLANATQAGADKITVSTRVRHNHPCQGIRFATVISIKVEDNGSGVPKDLETEIFTPLISSRNMANEVNSSITKTKNHGLGLAVAQQIARQHSGELVYKPRAGGSLFELLLPLEKKAETDR